MKVDAFTVRFGGGKSFYARVEGRLMTVVDAFCVLESGELPICLGMCSLAAKLQFERAEEGAKRVGISFLNEDGKLAMPGFETIVDVRMPGGAGDATVPFAFLIKQLSVPEFGIYLVDLSVDGRVEASTHVYARQKARRPSCPAAFED
jgi:hypothetical protein